MTKKTRVHFFGLFVLVIVSSACIAAESEPPDDNTNITVVEGTVWSWGENFYGQLGHGNGVGQPDTGTNGYLPMPISAVGRAIEVAAGYHHSMALDTQGEVWTWGQNDTKGLLLSFGEDNDGQLGREIKGWGGSPGRVPGLKDVRDIAAGANFSIAVMQDGTLRTWGGNEAGQLGDGTTEKRMSPVRVLEIDNVTTAAAGRGFAVALKNDGTVWGWGYNSYGQLGDGTKENRPTPVKMIGLEHVKAISCGDAMTMALKEDGTVWACGFNRYGNLGDGTEMQRTSPVQVKGLEGVVAIACANASHTLAIKNEGTVWAWGYGYKGELGLGEDESSARGDGPKKHIATKIPGLSNIKAVATGWDYSLAVDRDDNLWAWGRNWGCQFGVKEPRNSLVPVKIEGFSNVQHIVCGTHHTVAIRSISADEEAKGEPNADAK